MTATFTAAQPVQVWMVDLTFPTGRVDGSPTGTLIVSPQKKSSDSTQFLQIAASQQDPPALSRGVINVGDYDSDTSGVGNAEFQDIAWCDGCTRRILVRATPLQPLQPGSATRVVPLEFRTDSTGVGHAQPTIKVTPIDQSSSENAEASEGQTVKVKATVPAVRYISARMQASGQLRIVSDTPDVDVTIVRADDATTAASAGSRATDRTSRSTTAITDAGRSPNGVVTAPASVWMPAAPTCTDTCRTGFFLVAAPQHNYERVFDDDRERTLGFRVEVLDGDAATVRVTEPTVTGDSRDVTLHKGTGSGTWNLTGATKPAVSLALAGVFYKDGGNIVRGTIDDTKYEVSSSSLAEADLVGLPCSACEATVKYTTDTTGDVTVTLWTAVYAVDPTDPDTEPQGASVSAG